MWHSAGALCAAGGPAGPLAAGAFDQDDPGSNVPQFGRRGSHADHGTVGNIGHVKGGTAQVAKMGLFHHFLHAVVGQFAGMAVHAKTSEWVDPVGVDTIRPSALKVVK